MWQDWLAFTTLFIEIGTRPSTMGRMSAHGTAAKIGRKGVALSSRTLVALN